MQKYCVYLGFVTHKVSHDSPLILGYDSIHEKTRATAGNI